MVTSVKKWSARFIVVMAALAWDPTSVIARQDMGEHSARKYCALHHVNMAAGVSSPMCVNVFMVLRGRIADPPAARLASMAAYAWVQTNVAVPKVSLENLAFKHYATRPACMAAYAISQTNAPVHSAGTERAAKKRVVIRIVEMEGPVGEENSAFVPRDIMVITAKKFSL